MSFLTRPTVAAFFLFALLSAARVQGPVQPSSQATVQPVDQDIYALREHAAAGDAQAQFGLKSPKQRVNRKPL